MRFWLRVAKAVRRKRIRHKDHERIKTVIEECQ